MNLNENAELKPLEAKVNRVCLIKEGATTRVYVDLSFHEMKLIVSEIPTNLRFYDDAEAIEFAMELSGKVATVYKGVVSVDIRN